MSEERKELCPGMSWGDALSRINELTEIIREKDEAIRKADAHWREVCGSGGAYELSGMSKLLRKALVVPKEINICGVKDPKQKKHCCHYHHGHHHHGHHHWFDFLRGNPDDETYTVMG